MPPFHLVKVWYQNDWGRYARRDERLCRSWAADPRVGLVLHLEPPIARSRAAERPTAGRCVEGDGVHCFTPVYEDGDPAAWRTVLLQVAELFRELGVFSGRSVLWTNAPGPFAEQTMRSFGARFDLRVTEVEDDHRCYFDPQSEEGIALARNFEFLVRSADRLVSNNARMVEEFSRLGTPGLRIPNAVDLAAFENPAEAPEWFGALPGRRLLYVGTLRLRLEVGTLEAIAESFPEDSLVLCGEGAERLPASLTSRSNVHTPGAVAPSVVPALLSAADVLLLPHRTGELTDSMDPQKLPEYLASGRPIVATPVAGARERADLLELAEPGDAFVAAVRRVLGGEAEGRAQARKDHVAGYDWKDAARRSIDLLLEISDAGARFRREEALRYFEHDRPELRRRVESTVRDLLDIGCGAGAVGQALIAARPHLRVTGIECNADAAERARGRLHEVHHGDLAEVLPKLADQRFDCVLLADVLEHVGDAEGVLREVERVLRPGGQLLLGLPNVRHWSVLKQILEGDFEYVDAGILDRTHLRFYTRRSALRLLENAGFHVEAVQGSRWADEQAPAEVVEALARSGLRVDDLAEESSQHQWLFVARRVGIAGAREPVVADASPFPARARGADPVSVIVPVCNAAEYTRQCLEEIDRYGRDRLADVVVVDNGSTDETPQILAAAGVRVIRNPENLGYAAAVNQGLVAAQHEKVLVLNNDVLLMDGFLEALERALDLPNVAMSGPITNYANGRQQIDCAHLQSVPALRDFARRWAKEQAGKIEDVAFLSGFCFLARRSELLAAEGLAEAYGRGTFEDTELSRRLRRAGRRLVVAREGFVYHFGNRTFRTLGIDLAEQQRVNRKVFEDRLGNDAVMKARRVLEEGDAREAFLLLARQLVQEPTDLDAQLLATDLLIRMGRIGQAVELARRYLDRCPADPVLRAWWNKVLSHSEARSASRPDHSESPAGSSRVAAEV